MAAGWTHVCLVLAGLGWGAEAGQSYRGHQVVRARLETAAQAQLLAEAAELEQLDLWTRAGRVQTQRYQISTIETSCLNTSLKFKGCSSTHLILDMVSFVYHKQHIAFTFGTV